MTKATPEQRATVRRAIHSIFGHLSAPDLRRLSEAQAAVDHAGLQLGTSSQAKACGAKSDVVRDVVAGLSDFYVREIADYIAGNGRTEAGQ